MWLAVIIIVLCFSLVVLVGPPYLPTLDKPLAAALELLDLQPGQTLIELGCGDGKVLVAAARRGWKVVGIELNPILVVVCWLRTWRYHRQVKVVWGNYWLLRSWPAADGIFGFVLPRYMAKLDHTIRQWQHRSDMAGQPVKLASFAFAIPGKTVSRERDGVMLYKYPAVALNQKRDKRAFAQ
jgi:SAM-dependent methyltransferase